MAAVLLCLVTDPKSVGLDSFLVRNLVDIMHWGTLIRNAIVGMAVVHTIANKDYAIINRCSGKDPKLINYSSNLDHLHTAHQDKDYFASRSGRRSTGFAATVDQDVAVVQNTTIVLPLAAALHNRNDHHLVAAGLLETTEKSLEVEEHNHLLAESSFPGLGSSLVRYCNNWQVDHLNFMDSFLPGIIRHHNVTTHQNASRRSPHFQN